MSFCAFDDGAALFDATPVENMWIVEYMLRAPGDFVKVYLYGLMLCAHPSPRMSLSAMARDLDMTEEEVSRAFSYWARDGLVRQTGDNPVTYSFANVKQLTLTRAENPAEQLYSRTFTEEIRRILEGYTVGDRDYQTIFDWVDVLELPEEVVLMLLQTEVEGTRGRGKRFSFRVADRIAREWAQSGVRTVEDVERIVLLGKERERELRRLLARLGQMRNPSEDDKEMYRKWRDEWGFSADAIQEACRETTKGAPTMAYLDGILLRQHQLGRHEAQALTAGIARDASDRDFAREVFAGLGRTGVAPTQEDLSAVSGWLSDGFSREMILLAVREAHAKNGGGNLEDVGRWLERWRAQGFTAVEQIEAGRTRVLNSQLHTIYERAGLDKRANQPDRDLLCKWTGEMGMSMELILLAAQYARASGAPMLAADRILCDWHRAGIATEQAAQAEHAAHAQGRPAQAAQAGAAPMRRHTPDARRATYSAAMVNLDEEEDG